MVREMEAISFTLNGEQQDVNVGDYNGWSLAKYLREASLLTGTKVSCGEGGCGACIVTVSKFEGDAPRAVNSCLTPVSILDGWSITTVEGLGDKKVGYHPIQKAIVASGGSQCGYCTPGMVMQAHSYLSEHPNATMEDLDKILDGNICRCTGYRPILDALKTFGSDAPNSQSSLISDIEDLSLEGICSKSGKPCPNSGSCKSSTPCHSHPHEEEQEEEANSQPWFQPTTLEELTAILAGFGEDTTYRLVSGNTASGIFKREEDSLNFFVSLNKIPELKATSTSPMYLGGGVAITDAIQFFAVAGENNPVWKAISDHLRLIASVGIRNQGSLAGNLMIKNAHNDFPSDVFITLETVGATLDIVSWDGSTTTISVADFVTFDMHRKFIKRINFPALEKSSKKKNLNNLWLSAPRGSGHQTKKDGSGPEWVIRTFKIMPRSSNAHAYVNAGFLALVDKSNNFRIEQKPTVVFGGINSTFIHATSTEEFLIGRNMNDHEMFTEALTILAEELDPAFDEVLASQQYRKQLAMGLFYKFFLYALGDAASPEVQSGALNLERGLSKGQQAFETDEAQWPVTQPVEKMEGKYQASGEAEYVNDIPVVQGEHHAAFVLSGQANCDIVSVNTRKALDMPGVVAYIDHNDVPGFNGWKFEGYMGFVPGQQEEIFSTGKSNFAGQAIGLVVATTREIAQKAARMVEVSYTASGPIVTDMEEAMNNPENIGSAGDTAQYGDVDAALASSDRVIQGRFKMGGQYHMHMETHVARVTPIEDGFQVEVPTQAVDVVNTLLAYNLNIPANKINISVRRLGGSYGGKILLPTHLASAAAVAANKINKPVRLWVDMEDNMRMFGKRTPYIFDYKIGLDTQNKIKVIDCDLYCDGGWSLNDVDSAFAIVFGQSCYKIPNARFRPFGVKRQTPSPTATRAPGMCNGHAMIESILQHAAAEVGVSPDSLRLSNLMAQGDPIMSPPYHLTVPSPMPDMINKITVSADLEARRAAVQEFNTANRWKKRGLSMVPMRYDHSVAASGFQVKMHALVSVYSDGSVAVAHSGIEMGQGLNTKVQQVVAYELGIPIETVQIKPTQNLTNPGASVTGGSAGTESNSMAAIYACSILKERLEPFKKKLGTSATWIEIITAASQAGVDLCARYQFEALKDNYPGYSIWGVAVTEVEVDILTGEMYIVRADVLEDAGLSTNPQVDIGQVEGAFCMGLGMWTCEELKYARDTGDLLTKNTWEYKPPASKDIPQDMRISLLQGARNPLGCLSGKATGEPALLMSISVLFAIWDALNSSRKDSGLSGWWQLNGPATVEHIHQHTGISPEEFVF